MAGWFTTNRGWLVPSVTITGIIVLLFSYTLHVQHEKREEGDEIVVGNAVTPPRTQPPISTKNVQEHHAPAKAQKPVSVSETPQVKPTHPPEQNRQHVPATKRVATIAAPVSAPSQAKKTRPAEKLTPGQIIQRLQRVGPKHLSEEKQKVLGLHVAWSVYLFSAQKKGDDMFAVSFDSSETGFGVVIATDLNLFQYIGIMTARQGDKIRIAGTITGIDVDGTGQINLKVESIRPVDR